MPSLRPVPALLALALVTACGAADTAAPTSTSPSVATSLPAAVAESAGAQQPVEFSYAGADGPQAWGSLSPDFAACADGSAQSPIDLTGATARPLPDLEFDYRPGALELRNTTHTVQADETPGSAVVVGGDRYPLVQFHLHEPSEHLIDGKKADAELHLVHRDAAGRIAVVGVLLERGERDTALDPFLRDLPADPGQTARVDEFDPSSLLPDVHRSFRYTGSLTTPPCTEGVQWLVLQTPVEIAADQLEAFRSVIAQNDRPVQPRGDRVLLLDSDGG